MASRKKGVEANVREHREPVYITFGISGTTPLLVNRFSDEAALAATNGTSTTKSGPSKTPEEICESKLYRSDDGVIGMPTMNVLASIRDTGKFFKAGGRQLTTTVTSIIPAFVLPTAEFVPLVYKEAWRVDARPIVNPATKGRKLGYRPVFHDWGLSMEVYFAPDEFDVTLLREVIDAAGVRTGLGDYRPARKGPFGRFVVTSWRVSKEPAVKRAA